MPKSRRTRARDLLVDLGKEAFDFQADTVAECLTAIDDSNRLLVQAPTGSGKTLISQLTTAIYADELKTRYPRILVVVPSRGLLAQHFFDASWLRRRDLALHMLNSDLPVHRFAAAMKSYGVFFSTPVTLRNRMELFPRALDDIEFVIFDEIDTYLTVDELDERRDTWPLLEAMLESGRPILGFTGTSLDEEQIEAWESRSFVKYQPDVPAAWMPRTRVRFLGVEDSAVASQDAVIRDDLSKAFGGLPNGSNVTWGVIKALAGDGDKNALAVLRLCGERLRLFESPGSNNEKYERLAQDASTSPPALVMSRYVDVAQSLYNVLSQRLPTRQIDGQQHPDQVRLGMEWFRERSATEKAVLIMTRDLGGRGLDFPSAQSVIFVSPRSNYQTVAQEIARIRSRAGSEKEAAIYYYSETEEQAKAQRLAAHMRAQTFGGVQLFELSGTPEMVELQEFESRNIVYEESL